MAKVTITFEDREDENRVHVESSPSCQTIAMMQLSGEQITPAQAYALRAITAVAKASMDEKRKMNGQASNLWTPS